MFEPIYKKRRNPIYNIAGWALLALVCLIFVFVGFSPDVDFIGSSTSVAEVNGEPISYTDFNRYYERLQENRKSAKLTDVERKQIQEQAVNNLVDRSLIVQEAKSQKILIPVEELKDVLKQIPQFQDNGQFSTLRYKEVIRLQGMSEVRFEEKVTEDLLLQKMNGLYQRMAGKDDFIDKHEEKVSDVNLNIEFIRKSKIELSEAPTEAQIEEAVKSKSKDIADYYSKNVKTEFSEREQAKAQHILVKVSDKVDDKTALSKIESIAKELNKDNFADLAKKWSEDPGSKDRGGDLGYFGRGAMVKEFDENAFSLPLGTISKPFKTSFGYHIMLVTDRKPAKIKELEEVKREIARKLVTTDMADKAVDIATQAFKDKKGDSYISAKGWKWEETGVFSVGDIMIPKIGEDAAILAAALSVNPGEIAPEVVKKEDSYIFVRLKSLQKGGVKKQDQKMDFFKQFMEQQKSMELIQAWLDQLKKSAKVKINSRILGQN